MKAREIIATVLGAIRTEATRTVDRNDGNTEAVIVKIEGLLNSLPEKFNIDLHVEVTPSGAEKA
jgi:hypothetical protein